jgi:4-amino-4-deoxy-L-arabinose transferase-like glycosyltransferase
MNHQLYALLCMVLSFVGLIISWGFYKKNNYKWALILLMLCGFILRLFTASDFFLHNWDECYHALVAKHFIQNPFIPKLYIQHLLPYNYQDWTSNYIWVHKQPLPLWAMACSMGVFGINEITLRLPSLLLTTLGILLTYKIGAYFFSKKTAYIAAYFYAINGLIIELAAGRAATDHIDIFFLFFIQLAIYCCIKYAQEQKPIYNILVGLSIGAAILCKWLPALIILPIWWLIIKYSNTLKLKSMLLELGVILISATTVALPWQVYAYYQWPIEYNWESTFSWHHFIHVIEGHQGPFYFYFDRIRISYGELIYLPLLWFIYKLYKVRFQDKQVALLVWIFVPLLFFSMAQTKMQGYILFIAPALFIITAAFFNDLVLYQQTKKWQWLYRLFLIAIIALPIRYMVERVKPFSIANRQPIWVAELKKLNQVYKSNTVMFNYSRPIDAMFYTNMIVYSLVPSKQQILELLANGCCVVINNNGALPSQLDSIANVKYVNLVSPQ